METVLISPANVSIFFLPAFILYLVIPVAAIAFLTYILAKRMKPLVRSAPDFRFDNLLERAWNTYQLPHHRMPRYYLSGAIHISILFSLIVLSLRVISMVLSGVSSEFAFFEPGGIVGQCIQFPSGYRRDGYSDRLCGRHHSTGRFQTGAVQRPRTVR